MKIIDLLNKIANGEEAPKKIKYDGSIYKFDNFQDDYMPNDNYNGLLDELCTFTALNDEVEIIEEKEMCHKCGKYPCEYNQTYCEFCLGISKEDKKIEKLEYWVDVHSWVEGKDLKKGLQEQAKFNENIYFKINEIIDYINKKENDIDNQERER